MVDLTTPGVVIRMYELIILSLLMRSPLHGYLIAQIANDIIGPWAKISNGTLYPLLTKLEQNDTIMLVDEANSASSNERSVRTFAITEHGRARFFHLMMDTTSHVGDYQRIFHLKVPYLDIIQPRERLYLLNHYINYCQACLLHNTSHAESILHEISGHNPESRAYRELALAVMQERARLWQTEIDWTTQLRKRLVPHAQQEADPSTAASG